MSAKGLASSADVVATTAMVAVVVTSGAEGRYFSIKGVGFSDGSSVVAVLIGTTFDVSGTCGVSGVSGAGTLGTGAVRSMTMFSGSY